MQIKLIPYILRFKYPFRIAHTNRESTDNCYLVLEKDGRKGVGEAVFPPYQKENFFSLSLFISKYSKEIQNLNENNFISFLDELFIQNPGQTYALAALDTALSDFFYPNQSLGDGDWNENLIKETSYTIGISSPKDFESKIIESENHIDYFKLKVDQSNYEWKIKAFKKLTNKSFGLDANQGFQSIEEAVKCAEMAQKNGAMYLEQVFKKDDLENHRKLSHMKILPILADESFQTVQDLDKVFSCFDGMNVKLMKCGGLNQAIKAFQRINSEGKLSVLGCMSDSAIGMVNARKIAHLATWLDLDGDKLNLNSPSADFLKFDNI